MKNDEQTTWDGKLKRERAGDSIVPGKHLTPPPPNTPATPTHPSRKSGCVIRCTRQGERWKQLPYGGTYEEAQMRILMQIQKHHRYGRCPSILHINHSRASTDDDAEEEKVIVEKNLAYYATDRREKVIEVQILQT